MIPQLIKRIADGAMLANPGLTADKAIPAAAATVLMADPFDLVLHMDQVWNAAKPWGTDPKAEPAGPARKAFMAPNAFALNGPTDHPAWDHLSYSYVLENTRIVQILRRVVREYRFGEALGIPSVATQRWLDTTETLLFGAPNPVPMWLSTSSVRSDPEAVRRNAYWRLFGLDLAFGAEDNRPATYERATASNTSFVPLFEELMFELWQAMTNLRNSSGVNASDDDRIYRVAEQLAFILRSRRQSSLLLREELVAATALSWCELAVLSNTPIVVDLRADATSPGDRLRLIGERVGLAPHSKAASMFSMAADISILLRAIEASYLAGPQHSWLLYRTDVPSELASTVPAGTKPFGNEAKRVITEWSAATGRDLKVRAKPIETRPGSMAGSSSNGSRPVAGVR